MRASRSVPPTPLHAAQSGSLTEAVAVLNEIVSHLSERIELLETRDALRGHNGYERSVSRVRPAPADLKLFTFAAAGSAKARE